MAASGARSVPDNSFEFRLERMFAETPVMADADYFAVKALERLDRGWAARRLVIGVMGALGGLIGGFEILNTGALGQMATLAAHANDFMSKHATGAITGEFGLYFDPRVIWYAAALACVAAGLGLARLVREI
jgi:hypothetical protein